MVADTVNQPDRIRVACNSRDLCVEIVRPEQPRLSQPPVLRISTEDGSPTEVALDYAFGPRFFTVSDTGFVVTIDEWSNRQDTAYAVVVYDRLGQVLARYGLHDVLAVAEKTRSEASSLAEFGTWLSSAPKMTDAGDALLIAVAGAKLSLSLSPNARPYLHVVS